MRKYEQHESWGARVLDDGRVRFRVWAPDHRELGIAIAGERNLLAMHALSDGWHQLTTDRARSGSRYQFALPDGRRLPDPASRFQPTDVHGVSEVIDSRAYRWQERAWNGRPWHEAVLYELHVGTFTPEGTFAAVIAKLPHLVDLGVTGIELMPVAQFPGTRNWGYDGAFLFAPAAAYGRPEDLKALIDAAHQSRLMVILDVVYNHFGPEGNYLGAYSRDFFTERHKTPWGAGINFDGSASAPVRQFFIENALYWLQEFHIDGLRLDAVHAIVDDSSQHVLDELAAHLRELKAREVHLILENEENEAQRLERSPPGAPITFTAQWNDDIHHVLHTAATGERTGYYAEYEADVGKLARALAEGFAFQGELMEFRGHPRGTRSDHLPADAFVSFIQNHDQIGNRAFGERLGQIAEGPALRAVAAVYLLLPQIPMLFMGEEWAATNPFPFFCDFEGELAEQVRRGRRDEFARFPEFQDPEMRERIPDPQAAATFESAKLDWSALHVDSQAEWLNWYRTVLVTRRIEIIPRLPKIRKGATLHQIIGPMAIRVSWTLAEGEQLELVLNLSAASVPRVERSPGRTILEVGRVTDDELGPWTVRWRIVG